MSENKDYWTSSQEQGSIKISEDVIASIAALAVNEVPGVSALTAGLGMDIAEFLGKKSLSKGIKIQFSEGAVSIDAFVNVKYGFVISDVAKQIQEKVASSVESMTGLSVTAVNVNVNGVTFEKEEPKPKNQTKNKNELV